jgi:LPXTG-motif cell wall-anchored protein
MPKTASALPGIATFGGLLLALAGMLTFFRLRRES